MRKILPLLCALGFCIATDINAQNEIDYVNSYYWSGYGKMAIDHDTLYLNSMNGAGTERYYIADPANPVFIDRTNKSGFDQIDFGRRLMVDFKNDRFSLADFGDFDNVIMISHIQIPPQESYWNNPKWKLAGDYLFIALDDDSILTYDIIDPAHPTLSAALNVNRRNFQPFSYSAAFGSTVCVISYRNDLYWQYRDLYDIRDPNHIQYFNTDTVYFPTVGGRGLLEARGDTLADAYASLMGIQWYIQFVSFAENDTSHLPGWSGYGEGEWPPADFISGQNGFMLYYERMRRSIAYSYINFSVLGYTVLNYPYEYYIIFEIAPDNYLFGITNDSVRIFQPTYSDSIIMPQVNVIMPSHFGILSSCAYGNYVLSGAESNGGELLIHQLGQDGQLSLVAVLPGVEAKKIIISDSSAICLCNDRIVQVDLSNPASPTIGGMISGFAEIMIDFEKTDSIIFAITPATYNIISYYPQDGFALRSATAIPGANFTALAQYGFNSYLLKGAVGTVIEIESYYGINPRIESEYRLPGENYRAIDRYINTLWVSGEAGTDVVYILNNMNPITFFGPEYFADARNFSFSNDTLYVADGIGGVKVYKYFRSPLDSLRYIGGYSTGNDVNQLSKIGNNFFLSDYYSLHHLRWGAPTEIAAETETGLPSEIVLLQNYPNPFNAQTTIEFALPRASDVRLDIFDILGRKVATLFDGVKPAGRHRVVWDAGYMSSGIYFYRLHGNGISVIKKCMLMK